MKWLNSCLQKALVTLAYVASIVVAWHLLIIVFSIPDYIVPTPTAVFASLIKLPEYYFNHLRVTFIEALGGIILGHLFGFSVGLIMTYGGRFGRLINPLVIASQVFPKEALAPLFLVYLGFGITPKIIISALICFFPVAINTHQGLISTPRDLRKLMYVMSASPVQSFLQCELPHATRYIIAASKVCAVLGLVGAVVGEFVGSSEGLGYVIRSASADIGTDRSFAALLLLGITGGTLYGLVVICEQTFLKRLLTNPQ